MRGPPGSGGQRLRLTAHAPAPSAGITLYAVLQRAEKPILSVIPRSRRPHALRRAGARKPAVFPLGKEGVRGWLAPTREGVPTTPRFSSAEEGSSSPAVQPAAQAPNRRRRNRYINGQEVRERWGEFLALQ
jgi:hypothetical protein